MKIKVRPMTVAVAIAIVALAVVFIFLKPFDDHSASTPPGSVPDLPTDLPTESEPERLQLEEYIQNLYGEGWQQISEAQASEYLEPVTFGYMPEGSEFAGIFIKADPGIPGETMVRQLWCAADRSWLLDVTQDPWDGPDMVGDVTFTKWTDGGGQISAFYPWAAYYCVQQIYRDGVHVYMYMLVDETHSVYDCGEIMQTLEVAE